jgi:hypothetical protein
VSRLLILRQTAAREAKIRADHSAFTLSATFISRERAPMFQIVAGAMLLRFPYDANRLVAAWWVLTGRAYAFVWPKDGDLERVIIGDHATEPDAPEERKRA